jgi:glycosidase
VKKARPGTFVVGEVLDGATAALDPYLRAGFDSLFNYPLFFALNETFAAGGSVDPVADKVREAIAIYGIDTARRMTSFIDNHDNVRFTTTANQPEAETVARQHLALGAIFTLPGIPQLYYGDELALYGAKDPDNRRDMPAWAWSATDRKGAHAGAAAGDAQATFAFVQKLIAIRGKHRALQRGSYAELWKQGGGAANVLAFFRGDGGDRIVVAVNNAKTASGTIPLPIATSHNLGAADRDALIDGTVMDDLLGEGAPASVTIAGGVMPVALPGKTIAIYRARD